MTRQSIWVGYDPRPAETQCFAVARSSIRRRLRQPLPIYGLSLELLRHTGVYWRRHEPRDGRMWDVISDAPMSTEFAISRFLVPHLAGDGWALFADADVMARASLSELFAKADPSKACMVVKHDYTPKTGFKMDDQIQTAYPRKNWSSVVLWNCDHPGTKALTADVVNRERGLWLHQFSWLDDKDIGELEPHWNHLVGEQEPNASAKLVHFTNGSPNMTGHENCEYADEWRAELELWAK
jgi:lipopolysaccharide biosynthesis glycosyltransferase